MMEKQCSIFSDFTTPVYQYSINSILEEIKTGYYRTEIERIRVLYALGKKEEADIMKRKLPAFTPSGVFASSRKSENLAQYSGFVILDLDKLSKEEVESTFVLACNVPSTYACFRSPSGNGLKILVEVNTGAELHQSSYQRTADFYEKMLGQKIDRSGKDITRLCFMSYDPMLYVTKYPFFLAIDESKEYTPVEVTQTAPEVDWSLFNCTVDEIPEPIETQFDEKWEVLFEKCLTQTEKKKSYQIGERNNFIYLLANNCNRVGIPEQVALDAILRKYDLPENQIKASVISAYKHHKQEFAKVAKSANATKSAIQMDDKVPGHAELSIDDSEDYLKTTPTLPDEIFEKLPFVLADGCRVFSDRRKRDVYFTSAITILSGCVPNVSGVYFNERVHPHLFSFIVAPPASGKGVLKNAKRLADKYHQQVLAISKEAQQKYELELSDYKEMLRKRKRGETMPEKPESPPFKIIYIPADCSHSRMIEHLQNNGGSGIICETEADTMSGAKKQDWGDYSPALRAAFHHEKITFTRKTNNEYIEIQEPRLAVSLSGTPAQAPRLISSAEDGLFSRFLFYAFKNEIEWQDPSPNNKAVVYNDHFENLSDWVLDMVSFLEQSPTEVNLSMEQWNLFNRTFTDVLSDVTMFTGEDASGLVYRLGLIMFRICMVLTALRKKENGDDSRVLCCGDEDFETATKLVHAYLRHSILMFNNLPKQTNTSHFQAGDGKRKLFDALPAEFTRKQAVELGSQLTLSPRSVDEFLKTGVGRSFEKVKAGLYKKIAA